MERLQMQNDVSDGVNRKRSNDEALYSYVKRPLKGSKVIRIEIYDAKSFEDRQQNICKCKADLCVQHVVKNNMDGIYQSTKELIFKIQENIENVF